MTRAIKTLMSNRRVLGIDLSTNSFAFCVMTKKGPESWGEIHFVGDNVYARMLDARYKIEKLVQELNVKQIALEKTIKVRSVSVAIKMGYFAGIVISELLKSGAEVQEIVPLVWQRSIGNNPLTRTEKAKIAKANSGKSKSWLTNKARETRKQKTIDWVDKTYGIKLESDNVADAFGLAHYAVNKR